MRKSIYLLVIIIAYKSENLKAQVYKRLTGIDSIGYYSSYPPHLHCSLRFKYPNNSAGNREELRALLPFYYFPENFYKDCRLYSKFMFSAMKDSINPYNDTTHNFSRTSSMLSINNYQKVLMKNGQVSSYYDGTDTTGRYYYNSNGQITSEVFTRNIYDFKKVNYQYNNQNLLSIKEIEDKNNSTRYYNLFKYNNSGILIERIDSSLNNSNTYITRYKYKQSGTIKIINYVNGSGSSDDSFYYSSSGLLDSIKSNSVYGSKVFYYYDTNDYLDSVVYLQYFQKDVVKLYWETYTPNSSGITNFELNKKDRIAIYPNPSNGIFNILLNSESSALSIFNSLGQELKQMKVEKGMNTVNCSDLPKGIYNLVFSGIKECRSILIE